MIRQWTIEEVREFAREATERDADAAATLPAFLDAVEVRSDRLEARPARHRVGLSIEANEPRGRQLGEVNVVKFVN